jgi:aspartyl-tRNA(Asn)/glutamyl-tRNA(Gln) amidotransferase subunit A
VTELWELTARGLEQYFTSHRASPVEALDSVLDRISSVNGAIGAFATVLEESARAEAVARTAELSRGQIRGPLHGVPVGIKELFDVNGAIADYGSDTLDGRIADSDAQLVRRLRRAGALIVGTTTSHEFGWGITTQHPSRPGTRNPWNLDRVPGGSSGGSGAAVASGMVPLAVGSDTGGSVRIPASFCGVVGLKPSYGLIGRSGGVALAPSFDTPGALGRSIDDVATMVSIMSGADPGDSGSSGRTFRHEPHRPSSLAGTRIATSHNLMGPGLDASVGEVYQRTLDLLSDLGAELVEIVLPDAVTIVEAFAPIQMAEAYQVHSHDLALFPDRASDYGVDVRSRLEAAADVSISQYLAAQEVRRRIVADFEHAIRFVDAIISPISGVGPSRVDASDQGVLNGEARPLRELVTPFTVPQNMTGLPTCIVRAGFDADGLPVGAQLTGPRWREDAAVSIAATVQQALGSIEIVEVPNHRDRS